MGSCLLVWGWGMAHCTDSGPPAARIGCQRVPCNVPAIFDPSARSPQAGVPRQQHPAGSSGWRGCAEGRQQPAAVSGQRQRRSGSGRAGRSLAAAAAERRRRAAAGQQRRRRRQWRCCRRGPSCSQEAPCICRRWARNSGGVMGGHYCGAVPLAPRVNAAGCWQHFGHAVADSLTIWCNQSTVTCKQMSSRKRGRKGRAKCDSAAPARALAGLPPLLLTHAPCRLRADASFALWPCQTACTLGLGPLLKLALVTTAAWASCTSQGATSAPNPQTQALVSLPCTPSGRVERVERGTGPACAPPCAPHPAHRGHLLAPICNHGLWLARAAHGRGRRL